MAAETGKHEQARHGGKRQRHGSESPASGSTPVPNPGQGEEHAAQNQEGLDAGNLRITPFATDLAVGDQNLTQCPAIQQQACRDQQEAQQAGGDKAALVAASEARNHRVLMARPLGGYDCAAIGDLAPVCEPVRPALERSTIAVSRARPHDEPRQSPALLLAGL